MSDETRNRLSKVGATLLLIVVIVVYLGWYTTVPCEWLRDNLPLMPAPSRCI